MQSRYCPGQQIVKTSENGILTLTTKRVRYDSIVWGQSNLISITLGSVASCGLVTKSYPLLLILSAIALVVSFTQQSRALPLLILIAAVLFAAYFFTRRSVISVASNGGGAILTPTKGMKREDIISFIDAVEREKLK
jgi:hypothetical protein